MHSLVVLYSWLHLPVSALVVSSHHCSLDQASDQSHPIVVQERKSSKTAYKELADYLSPSRTL